MPPKAAGTVKCIQSAITAFLLTCSVH